MTLYIRYPEAELSKRFWYARFFAPDTERPGHTKAVLWNTHRLIKQNAALAARQERDARFAGQRGTTTRAAAETTIADVLALYAQHATCADATASNNAQCLLNVIRRTFGDSPAPETRALALLNADALRLWRTAAERHAKEKAGADPVALGRTMRGQNSTLNQARAVFAPLMLEHYEQHGIKLPAGLTEFLTRPKLKAPTKSDYQKPDDLTLLRTFASLEDLRERDRNLYLAVWLALGFGLRKEEISNARRAHLVAVNGRIHCRLVAQKNDEAGSQAATDIPVQNGAWAKLEPLLSAHQPNDYLLTGPDTERADHTFRRISSWMRDLGWKTQKTAHEWRAYAGCSVTETHGLDYASRWLRHSSPELTRRAYGRYAKTTVALEAPLMLPVSA